MVSRIRQVGAWTAAVLAYTSTALAVWALPWSVSNRLVLLLAILLLLLVGILVVLLQRLDRIRVELRTAEDAAHIAGLTQLELDALANGMVAFSYAQSQKPVNDIDHHFISIREEFRIDGDDATFTYELRGRRVNVGASDYLSIKVSGDVPVDAASLMAEAKSLPSDEPLEIEFERDEPYLKVLRIKFATPAIRGQEFRIHLSLRWNGTFPRDRRYDYLFSNWGVYASRGVEKLTTTLSSDLELRDVVLYEIGRGKRQRRPSQPRVQNRHGRCDVSWYTHNPSKVYLLQFEKLGDR
jgi:hypothetical protein